MNRNHKKRKRPLKVEEEEQGKIGKMDFRKYILKSFLILIFITAGLSAQDVRIKAGVDKNQVDVNGQFQYSVEVSGKSTSLPDVAFPDFKDFYVLSGPNSSTSIQWINGAMTSSKTFSYYLRPRKEGKLKIGKSSITYKGKTITSDEIIVTVKTGAVSSQPGQSAAAPKSRRDADIAGESLYLKTEVSKRNVYLGEQIIIKYKLYFRMNVRGFNIDKMPSNAGFWAEEFKMPSQPVIENEVVNGINYNVAVIKKTALFPTQCGELTMEPMQATLEAVVRSKRRSRSLFDSFFDDPFGRTVQKTISSKPVTIKVKPLPKKNKPLSFRGAVGNYNFNVSVDKKEVNANEAISMKIKLNGSGNIKLAELPKAQIPPDIEKYEPKITSKIHNEGNIISGSKTAEYILIPRIAGQYQIKPIVFSYFDPVKKGYKTISSGDISLNILKGSGTRIAFGRQADNMPHQAVALIGQDIRYIKEYSHFNLIGFRPYISLKFWISIFAALLLFGGFYIYNDYQSRLSGNEQLARRKKAGKIAARQLSEAKKQLNAKNQSMFYKAVSQALQGFVQDKLNIELTDFSAVNVKTVLKQKGISDEEIKEYLNALEESDFRQFANISASLDERNELFEQAKSALTKLEKWI
jgi:hypothetical protein